VRRRPVAAALVLLAAAGGCGGESGGDRLRDYVEDANRVQASSAAAFKRAQATYAEFARGRLSVDDAAARLAAAEAAIRSARVRVARLRPPAEARELRRRLLAVYDLNIGLAGETTRLASYSPARAAALRPLRRANARLSSELEAAAGDGGRRRALARYAGALARVVAALGELDPPPLLAESHRAEIERIGSARSLAVRLGRTIGAGDARRTARTLLRFRAARSASSGSEAALGPEVLRAYDRRLAAVTKAQQDLRREEERVREELT
jgi:hypothetical protein